jgi:hypothetical protein
MQVSLAIDLKKAYRPIQTYTIGRVGCECGAVLTVACGVQEPHVASGNRCEESNERSNSSLSTSQAHLQDKGACILQAHIELVCQRLASSAQGQRNHGSASYGNTMPYLALPRLFC